MSLTKLIIPSALTLGAYFLVENRQLKVTECEISSPKLPESFNGKKVLLLADLHKKRYGDNFNNLMNSVIAAEPDYIFFAGDLYSRSETDLIPKIALMKRLKDTAPTFYVTGNHEICNMDNCEALCLKLSSMGINVLRNNMTRIYQGNDYINVYGTQLSMRYYMNHDGSYKNLPELTCKTLTAYLGTADKSACNLLISHNPFFLKAYAEWGADMVFSGHCHGGAINLPLVGGLLSPERKFFPRYTKGLYTMGSTTMALTAGLGKFRLNNPSEIMSVTLKKTQNERT